MTDNPLAPQRPEPGQHVPDGSEVVADLAARIEGFKDMLLGGLPTGPEAAEGVVPAPPPVAAREEQGADIVEGWPGKAHGEPKPEVAPPAPSPDVASLLEAYRRAVIVNRDLVRPNDEAEAKAALLAAFAAQARRTEEAERELRRVVQETGGDPETWMGAAEQVRSRMCEHDQMTAERRELRARLMELPEWLDREMRDLADCNQFGKGYSMDALNHACAHLRRNLEREIRALLGGADREGA
jgi:hypothetical protein